MAPQYPVYSTKTSQPGVIDQLWDLQKYGRTQASWIGQTTNATATEIFLDNFSWSLPASTSPSTNLQKRFIIPADSIMSGNLYGCCFDVTSDSNAGSGEGNASFSVGTFSVINISGTHAFVPAAAPTVVKAITSGAAAGTAIALTVGATGLIVTVTGVAAKTINWHIMTDFCVARYIGSPALGQYGI
jgi:hypothetical protein